MPRPVNENRLVAISGAAVDPATRYYLCSADSHWDRTDCVPWVVTQMGKQDGSMADAVRARNRKSRASLWPVRPRILATDDDGQTLRALTYGERELLTMTTVVLFREPSREREEAVARERKDLREQGHTAILSP